MNVSELSTKKKCQIKEYIIKMNDKTVQLLRDIAKEQGLRGYYKLEKADLIALLSEQSAQEMPSEHLTQEMATPPPRTKKNKRRSTHPVKIIPQPFTSISRAVYVSGRFTVEDFLW